MGFNPYRSNVREANLTRYFPPCYRFVQGYRFENLAKMFNICRYTAIKTYQGVLFCLFMTDTAIPTWNELVPDQDLTNFLISTMERQSPGLRHIADKMRTPDGRRVCFVCIDATQLNCQNSSNAFYQMNRFSGSRGKGHCVLQTTLTCPAGSVLAIAPGQ